MNHYAAGGYFFILSYGLIKLNILAIEKEKYDNMMMRKGKMRMKADKDTIQYTAEMAKLNFTEKEMNRLLSDFEEILKYFDNTVGSEDLTELNIDLEPSSNVIFRRDKVQKFGNRDELLQNTKQMRDGFVVIPKVLE